MSKSNIDLLGFFKVKQKTGSEVQFGHRMPQTNISLTTKLSLFSFILLGLFLATSLSLLGPTYFYPGTLAARWASQTLDSLSDGAVKPLVSEVDALTRQVKDSSRNLTLAAPLSINTIFNQPLQLPKLVVPSPVLATPKEIPTTENIPQATTELIAQTIKASIDPMLEAPQVPLFPTEISLDQNSETAAAQTVAQSISAKEVTKVEKQPVSALPVQKTIKTTPVPVQITIQTPVISGNYRWPLTGLLSQRFSRFHPGIDIATKYGTAVFPLAGGVVSDIIIQGIGLGKHIVIDHGGGLKSVYAHLSEIRVSVGQSVTQETIIGAVGMTGRTTGPHLHLEVRQNGSAFNPLGTLLN